MKYPKGRFSTLKRLLGRLYQLGTNNRLANKLTEWSELPSRQHHSTSKLPHVQLYDTLTGAYYLPTDAPNDVVINTIKSGKIFEPKVHEIAKTLILPGTAALDLGANFGQMSILFARLVGPEGKVHSFEADPFIFELLQQNISINSCENITAHLGAVHNEMGKKLLYPVQDFKRFPSYGSYGIDPRATEGREIDTITIDSLDISMPISFMKVDVQGSDLFAMQGAVNTIKKHKMPILFEFEQQFQTEFKTSFQQYVEFVASIGYQFDQVVMEINYLAVPR